MAFENYLKTALLLGILTALLLWVGSFFGPEGLTIAIIFVLIMNLGSYFFSHKIVLAIYRAKEVAKNDNQELHAMIEDLAHKAQIPKPKIYIVPSDAPNAFATGPNPKKAVVAVTQGILKMLSHEELKGVLAHEMAHVKNRDILISTIAAMVAGIISYIAMIARWGAIFGGFGRDDNGSSNIGTHAQHNY